MRAMKFGKSFYVLLRKIFLGLFCDFSAPCGLFKVFSTSSYSYNDIRFDSGSREDTFVKAVCEEQDTFLCSVASRKEITPENAGWKLRRKRS